MGLRHPFLLLYQDQKSRARKEPRHRRGSGVSKELLLSEGSEAAIAQDYVVEDLDADEVTGMAEPVRDRPVLCRRFRVAGRMVVHQDQARGAREDRGLEHFPWLCCGRTYVASRLISLVP